MINSEELARILGVTRECVGVWAIAGKIPFVVEGGGRGRPRRLFDLGAVCEALGIGVDEAESLGDERRARKAKGRASGSGRQISPDRNYINISLTRIVRGNLNVGDTCAQLSTLTGIPYTEIRERVDDVEYTYSNQEKLGRSEKELSSDDLKTLVARYNKSDDPAVRAFLESIRRPAKAGQTCNQELT